MEGPIKKRKHTVIYTGKILFDLVFPYLFFGELTRESFFLFLALCGICRQLRYFQTLRRFVAYLAPMRLKFKLREHGFHTTLAIEEAIAITEKKRENGELLIGEANTVYFLNVGVVQNPFQRVIRNVPFFDLMKRVDRHGKSHLLYTPQSFCELALFWFCVASEHLEMLASFDGVETIPAWKSKNGDYLSVPKCMIQNYTSRFLLNKLARIGTTAPLDIEFARGGIPDTGFSVFMSMCQEKGDKRSALTKLGSFVKAWYPMTRFPVGPADLKSRAYVFKMEFE